MAPEATMQSKNISNEVHPPANIADAAKANIIFFMFIPFLFYTLK